MQSYAVVYSDTPLDPQFQRVKNYFIQGRFDSQSRCCYDHGGLANLIELQIKFTFRSIIFDCRKVPSSVQMLPLSYQKFVPKNTQAFYRYCITSREFPRSNRVLQTWQKTALLSTNHAIYQRVYQ